MIDPFPIPKRRGNLVSLKWNNSSVPSGWEKRNVKAGPWFLTWATRCACAKLLQSCLTLCNPMDRSPPGSSVHGILQARILEWVAMPFSR